jgi:putative hydrolase of HD superfamily
VLKAPIGGRGCGFINMQKKFVIGYILRFFEDVERLKRVPRSGWWYYGIVDPESVADHSFAVVFFTYLLCHLINESEDLKIDTHRAVEMALLHELGECRLGDLQREARRFLGEGEVEEAERSVVKEITEGLGSVGERVRDVYDEFLQGKTLEARLVHFVDKFELLMQALLYRKFGHRNLRSILDGQSDLLERFKSPLLEEILREITKLSEDGKD